MTRIATWALACPLALFAIQLAIPSGWADPAAALSLKERRMKIQMLAKSIPADPKWVTQLPMNVALVYRYQHPGGGLEIVNTYPVGAKQSKIGRDTPFAKKALPDYFLVGDGALEGRVLLVDKRPGSRLSKLLDELVRQMLELYGKTSTAQLWDSTVSAFLANQVQDYLTYPQGGLMDPAAGVTPAVDQAFAKAMKSLGGEPVGSQTAPVANYKHPVRSFDDALKVGKGICIDMALLASFVLERFGIEHRVVFGATVSATDDSQSGGHTWVELATGEILDPTWKLLGLPGAKAHPDHSDWQFVGHPNKKSFRFGYPAIPLTLL